jgi:hypothetical protein
VRAVIVVVVLVCAEHSCGVPLVEDQNTVEEFTADAADKAFCDSVGPRCPHWCPDDADGDGGEHRVERGGELGIAIPDEEPDAAAVSIEIHEQVASQLGQPRAGRVSGDAEDVLWVPRTVGLS